MGCVRGNVVRTEPEPAFTYRPPRVWSAQTRTKSMRVMRATCCEDPWRESSCLCEAPIARMSGALESDTSIRLKLMFSPSQHAERFSGGSGPGRFTRHSAGAFTRMW